MNEYITGTCLFYLLVLYTVEQRFPIPSADPRLLGALCRMGGLACVVEIKDWMQRICLYFTQSRITLAENAHLFRGSVCFQLARDCTIFMLHSLTDFYVGRVTAHRIKIYDHSCFHKLWPNSKMKLK